LIDGSCQNESGHAKDPAEAIRAGFFVLNLFIYLVIGGIIGWIASVIMRTDKEQGVLLNIIVGVIGAYLAGLLTNGGAINRSLDGWSLLAALCGAVLLLGIMNLIRKGRIR
jgi:uncharacterized membrane protein YeaQ/YmgE (transglycosylase-associated protein family)